MLDINSIPDLEAKKQALLIEAKKRCKKEKHILVDVIGYNTFKEKLTIWYNTNTKNTEILQYNEIHKN